MNASLTGSADQSIGRSRPAFSRLRRLPAIVLLLAAGVLMQGQATTPATISPVSEPVAQTAFVPATLPSKAIDGILHFEIGQGAFDAFARSEPGFVVPDLIQLQVGDTVEIVNHDSGAHMIFYAFVPPETTSTMRFDEPGIFTYSSGCAVNPAMNSFTTVIVSA